MSTLKCSKTLQWYVKASAVAHAAEIDAIVTPEVLRDEHHRLNWAPPFPRWKVAITEVLSHIEANIDVLPLVEEWSRDVRAGFRNTYLSRISKQQGGHKLTEAWIHYFCFANYQSVINSMTPFIKQARSPVSDLAGILLELCYMRQALFQFQPSVQIYSTNSILRCVSDDMKTLVELGNPAACETRPNLENLSRFAASLPLRPEDTAMIEAVQTGRLPDNQRGDWLTCYYICRLSKMGMLKQQPPTIETLSLNSGMVPASPEQRRIIDALEGN